MIKHTKMLLRQIIEHLHSNRFHLVIFMVLLIFKSNHNLIYCDQLNKTLFKSFSKGLTKRIDHTLDEFNNLQMKYKRDRESTQRFVYAIPQTTSLWVHMFSIQT